jgi:hypothetical protein
MLSPSATHLGSTKFLTKKALLPSPAARGGKIWSIVLKVFI